MGIYTGRGDWDIEWKVEGMSPIIGGRERSGEVKIMGLIMSGVSG